MCRALVCTYGVPCRLDLKSVPPLVILALAHLHLTRFLKKGVGHQHLMRGHPRTEVAFFWHVLFGGACGISNCSCALRCAFQL